MVEVIVCRWKCCRGVGLRGRFRSDGPTVFYGSPTARVVRKIDPPAGINGFILSFLNSLGQMLEICVVGFGGGSIAT